MTRQQEAATVPVAIKCRVSAQRKSSVPGLDAPFPFIHRWRLRVPICAAIDLEIFPGIALSLLSLGQLPLPDSDSRARTKRLAKRPSCVLLFDFGRVPLEL